LTLNDARFRYELSHWSRQEDPETALKQYLNLGERPFNKIKQRLISVLAGDVHGKTILDYGGGAGIMAIPFAKNGANVLLVDAEDGALRTAAFYAATEGVENSVTTLHSETFPTVLSKRRFDLVIAKDIIEHIADDASFLQNLASCQRPGDILIVSTQNSFSLNYLLEGSYQKYWCNNRGWMGWDKTHLRFYTSVSLGAKLREAGYHPQRWASIYILPYTILGWLSLSKIKIEMPWLRWFDLVLGRAFPFNRCGWNIIVRAEKVAR
jgi:2-polyprenyl-6-hydroxyphenyl methylase / 3-demethylubiquinone-9 3-methyltransferase